MFLVKGGYWLKWDTVGKSFYCVASVCIIMYSYEMEY